MKILITCPSLETPHGGIRVIVEWANNLSSVCKHDVSLFVEDSCLYSSWITIHKDVRVTAGVIVTDYDVIIITSPHSMWIEPLVESKKTKVFVFIQMLEHLFNIFNPDWQKLCDTFYKTKNDIISISHWNMEHLLSYRKLAKCKQNKIHYIRNGINLLSFPILKNIKKENVVLVEGWEQQNTSKDVKGYAIEVCEMLKKKHGVKIIVYSSSKPTKRLDIVDEYHYRPTIQVINSLLAKSKILLKVSKFDARSCSPIEAMTKGTVCVRGIECGDDDLVHMQNCLRSKYIVHDIYENCERLLTDPVLYKNLQESAYNYVEQLDWKKVILEINEIIR